MCSACRPDQASIDFNKGDDLPHKQKAVKLMLHDDDPALLTVRLSPQQLEAIRLDIQDLLQDEIKRLRIEFSSEVRYLNKADTCTYLHISNNTLDKWIYRGFPVITIGGTVRFDKVAITQWLNSYSTDGNMFS